MKGSCMLNNNNFIEKSSLNGPFLIYWYFFRISVLIENDPQLLSAHKGESRITGVAVSLTDCSGLTSLIMIDDGGSRGAAPLEKHSKIENNGQKVGDHFQSQRFSEFPMKNKRPQ
jgi:hypothetical protein